MSALQAPANAPAQQLHSWVTALEQLASQAQPGTSEALATSQALLATSGAMVQELWALAILPASLATSRVLRVASLVSLEASGASLGPVQAQPAFLASLEASQGGNYSQGGKQRSEQA